MRMPTAVLAAIVAVLGCARGRSPAPSGAPTNSNVKVRLASESFGTAIFLMNGSAVPVLATEVALSNCRNVAIACDTLRPNELVPPGEQRVIARIPRRDADKRPSFAYRYRWVVPGARSAPPTVVTGPETSALAARVSGVLVSSQPMGKLLVVRFPGAKGDTISRDRWQAQWLSGPDSAGTVAMAVDSTGWTMHELRLRKADGREEVLARRVGGILWHNAVGQIALAPSGGRIAFISKRDDNPNNYQPLRDGALELWDPATRKIVELGVTAHGNSQPVWFPDGRRLLYVRRDSTAFQVMLLDVETRESTPLLAGEQPVLSDDGRFMILVRGQQVTLVDLEKKSSRPLTIPGIQSRPLAFVDSRYVIFRGLATEGRPTGQTQVYSPMVGPRPLVALKIFDIQTGEFATLMDRVDPRDRVTGQFRILP